MSVYIDNCYCSFTIKKENIAAALTKAKELVQSGGYADWTAEDQQKLLGASSIDEFLRFANNWYTEVENFNIIGLIGKYEQYYQQEDLNLFKTLAPYVEAGSYINIETNNFQKIQWYFDGITCITKEGQMDYDCNIEIVEAILQKKEMLPTMLGIHPELDKRIAKTLKGENHV